MAIALNVLYNPVVESLAEFVDRRMRELGLGVRQLAQLTGLSHAAVSFIVKGTTKRPGEETLEKLAGPLHVSEDELRVRAGYKPLGGQASLLSGEPNMALAAIAKRMLHRQRLRSATHASLFTNGALTPAEVEHLLAGYPPSQADEERLVRFFRRMPMDDVKAYYAAAGLPLPADFEDLLERYEQVVDLVAASTDGSPEALEEIIRIAQEAFERRRKAEGG